MEAIIIIYVGCNIILLAGCCFVFMANKVIDFLEEG